MNCPKCGTDNSGDSRFCKACATPLPVPGADDKGFPTQTLQTPVTEIATGTTLAGRYQVIEELGHGGMGRVYKVFDTDIKEKIALKLLRPEIALDKETVERFSNELKLARKISHRNVCRMFDLGKAEGTTFITMEFVPGEDLKKLIRKTGQLGAGRAVSIAKQVCEGLEEAHHLGVVHRDLKPQNLMVDEDGNVRIMDFGIARSLRGKGITGAGVMIGTPEYMSPEQVEGKEVDQRSDVYSLGIILYEMVTGHVPFEGDTAFTIGVKHKSERPRNPRELNAQLPEDLSRLILRCLEKDKGKRYQTAEELRTELEKVEQGLPTTERTAPKRRPMTSREISVTFSARKLVIPVLALILVVAGGILLWRVIPPRKRALTPSVSGMPTLAVLYFENKSGDAKLDYLREVLAELINTDLSQSRFIRVVTGEEIYTTLKRLGLAEVKKYSSEDIEKIATQTRASHILRGSYIKSGEGFIITAGLQRPGAVESPTALRLEASNEKDIIVKVDELTRQVKEGLNLTRAQVSSDIEKDAGAITTSSLEALKYYIEGRKLQMGTEYKKAIAFMEKAIDIDPEFGMAYRALATLHSNMGHDSDSRRYLKKALELSARLPENERLLIEGQSFYFDENYAKAIEVYERLVKAYPSNATAQGNLAIAYLAAGDIDKALQRQEIAVQIQRTAQGVGHLAGFYCDKGLYQRAEDVCRSFLLEVEENQYVRRRLRDSYSCRSKFGLALAEAEKLDLLNPDMVGYYKGGFGDVLLLKGDIASAEKVYQQVFEKDRAAGRGYLYRLALIRGKFGEGVRLAQQTLEESKGKKEDEAGAYGGLADALIRAGRHEDAYKAFGQWLKLSAENRKLAGESGAPYLPNQEKWDLFTKGKFQAEMKSFEEAVRTADELKALIDKGINKKDLRFYEYTLGLVELGKKNYRQAAGLFGKACGRLDFESEWNPEYALLFDGLARAFFGSGDIDKARTNYEKITLLTLGRLGDGDIYAKAFYMLGKIAEQQGDKARAVTNYRKFLDLWKDADPGLPEVPDAKARLAALI